MKNVKTWKMTWEEVKDAVDQNKGIIIPIGATEQHGKHLPICTDSLMAKEITVEIAERNDMVVAQPIVYTCKSRPQTGGGMNFIGTIGLPGQVFIPMVAEVIKGYMRHGFKKILLLNHHMENNNLIYDAAWQATDGGERTDVKIGIFEMPFNGFSDELMQEMYQGDFAGWGYDHAAIYESAALLYRRPDVVKWERAVDDRPEAMVWYDALPIPDEFSSKSGTLWKCTHATAEMGEKIWNELIAQLDEAVKTEFPMQS